MNQIRPACAQELPALAAFLDRHLGVVPGRLDFLSSEEARQRGLLLVGEIAGELAGVAMALCYPVGEAHVIWPAGTWGIAAEHLAREQGLIGYLDTLAVSERYRRRGLGSALVATRVRWLDERGASVSYAFAWVHPQLGAQSASLLEGAGFVALERIPAFWANDSAGGDDFCPSCGRECACAALVYRRCARPC